MSSVASPYAQRCGFPQNISHLWTVASPVPMGSILIMIFLSWFPVGNSFVLNRLVLSLPVIFSSWLPALVIPDLLSHPRSHISQFLLYLCNIYTIYTYAYVHIHILLVLLLWLKPDCGNSQSWMGPWREGSATGSGCEPLSWTQVMTKKKQCRERSKVVHSWLDL